jgi:uncharacterized protein (DUF362 family)
MKDNNKKFNSRISRKEFLKRSTYIALSASIAPWAINVACSGKPAEAETAKPLGNAATAEEAEVLDMCVAKNADPYNLTRKAVNGLGGMAKFVSKGDKVALVPNIGWARTPEQGANTNPGVVKALVEMCFEAGAKQVEVFCNPCVNPKVSYQTSGIGAAAQEAGAFMLYLSGEEDYSEVQFPDAVWSKNNFVAKALLEADVFINAPIAKTHGTSKLTMLQKNLMGVVTNRGVLHQNIHRELVALQKVLPAALYVLDCSRIMIRNGPTGGNLDDVVKMDQCVAGRDPIAIESYGATLFQMDPMSIGFIKLGYEAGLGKIYRENSQYKVVH